VSTVRPDIDLGGLRRDPAQPSRAPGRRWLWLAPALLAVAFVAVLLSTAGDLLARPRAVSVVRPVRAGRAEARGSVLLQAAGWVEADPFPTRVTPLASGVVRSVLVQERDSVEAGQPVATLDDAEAQIAVAEAQGDARTAAAELGQARAEEEAARAAFEAALEVTEAALVAEAEHRAAAQEVAREHALAEKGRASLRLAEEELELQRRLEAEGAAGPRQVQIAEARVEEAQAEIRALLAAEAAAREKEKAAAARLHRAREALRLRIADTRERDRTREARIAAEGRLERAEALLAAARLRLERMTVRAPAAGVVLARLAVPGQPVGSGDGEGGAICTLFDPDRLRVRVDVPQELVAQASSGQEARILATTRPARPYRGSVIRIVTQADINKVTLQVHVAVQDPDELLRPETLCQVQFLAMGTATEAGPELLRLPARVVEGDAVWLLLPDGRRATRRKVQVQARDGDWVLVAGGVNESDKVIDSGREGLVEGARVQIEGGF
jgi:RND family efflux transporter MFP subunit